MEAASAMDSANGAVGSKEVAFTLSFRWVADAWRLGRHIGRGEAVLVLGWIDGLGSVFEVWGGLSM